MTFTLIGQPDGPFPQTGWIVFFCLLVFLIVVAFIFVLFHKRTRKQISGFCCRKYRTLWPDQRDASSDLMTAEDHYVEHVTNTESEWSMSYHVDLCFFLS